MSMMKLRQINQLKSPNMNKTDSQGYKQSFYQPQQEEAGVGDHLADPEREIIHWTAIFFEGKFYLTDPPTVSKLQEVQAEIELEKKIATSVNGCQREKAESVRGLGNRLNESHYSCVTEHNPEKSKLKQIIAEKELERQQESNIKRLIEAKHKKSVQKKRGKNLIQVKPRHQEEFVSQKEHQIKFEKDQEQPWNQSMMSKINIPERDRNAVPTPIEAKVTSSQIEIANNYNNAQPQSPVRIIFNESFTKKEPVKMNQVYIEEEQLPQHSYCVKINIKEPNDQNKNLLSHPTKPLEYEQEIILSKSQLQNKKEYYQQSQILKRVVVEDKKQPEKNEEVSILDLQSHEEAMINEESSKERAGIIFFNEINSEMYKLQMNLDGVNRDDSIQLRKIIEKESKHISDLQKSGAKRSQQESAVLQDTKNILKQINERLDSMNFMPQQTKKQEKNSLSDQKLSEFELLQHSFKSEKQGVKNTQQPNQEKLKDVLQSEQNTPKPISPELMFKKKKECSVSPSIFNYQIAGSPVISKDRDRENMEEKQKLTKQINVLQQVIGELRVQRIKYQASQNYTSKIEGESVFSGLETMERDLNARRLSEVPTFYQTHRPTGTLISNFEESVVSEFQTSRPHQTRLKSGKIVKNQSPQRKMTQIEEEKHAQYKIFKVEQEIQQNKITEQREQSKNITEVEEKGRNEEERSDDQTYEKKQKIIDKPESLKQEKIEIGLATQTISDKSPKPKTTQYKIKVSSQDKRRKSYVSEPKSRQTSSRKGSVVVHEDQPLPNKSQRTESDLESSMPRALISKYNYSVPPKITVQEHSQHKKIQEHKVQKNLMQNFQKIQRNESKISNSVPQPIDPKRRAMRQGILKNIEYKTSCNPDSGKQGTRQIVNVKQKICEEEKKKQKPQQARSSKDEKSITKFRMRKDSQSSRNSRMSDKSSKKSHNQAPKQRQNLVYVPALSHPSVNNSNSTPQEKDNKLYELSFKFPEKPEKTYINSGFTVKKREISFSDIKIPVFPEPPQENITMQGMVQQIRKIEEVLDSPFEDTETKKIIMKKYKNCIMLDLPGQKKLKLVWHYNGKVYLGEWSESAMMKSGEGIQYVPEKYYYKGQFFNNKRNGTGTIILQNGSRYEGQWLEGQKNGRGKYLDKETGLYYEGQWTDGKRDGYGYLQLQNRSIYQGTFSNNHLIGYGTEKFSNGDSYKGQYEKGKFNGKGTYVWSSGSSYEGSFISGKKHGEGKWKSQTGELYIGDYFQDKKHGFGRYKWENGCIYEGEFSNDRKHGNGSLRYPDGREVLGIWKQGQLFDLVPVEDNDAPLEPKKSKVFQTRTVIKVTETKPNKFSSTARLSQI